MRCGVFLLALVFAARARAEGQATEDDDAVALERDDRRLLARIDQLRDDDRWKARMEAAVFLGRSGDIRARRPLTKALLDPHYAVRAAAVRSLTNLGDARAVRPILDRLGDDEPFVRTEARRAIERFDLTVARPYLIHALRRHTDPSVRLGAAERLAESGDPTSQRALLDAIGDDEPVGRFAVSALRALPEEHAIAMFLQGLEQADYGVQVAAIRALADMGTARATEPFIRLLDSEVPEVTIAATRGLRALSEHIDRSKMLVLAKRASRFERARALKVLGVLGGEDAAQLLLHALDDMDVLVRGAAVNGLGTLGDVRAIPKLEEMKKEEANGRIISLVRTTLTNLQRIRREKPKASLDTVMTPGAETGEIGRFDDSTWRMKDAITR